MSFCQASSYVNVADRDRFVLQRAARDYRSNHTQKPTAPYRDLLLALLLACLLWASVDPGPAFRIAGF